jgi:hypothetical protein
MTKIALMILLATCGFLAAGEPIPSTMTAATATAVSPSAESGEDFQPSDVLYAPEDLTPGAQAAEPSQAGASYYSQARLLVSDFGHAGRPVEGAELFIDGQFVGTSPVTLNGFLVNKPRVSLSAHEAGYHDSVRPDFVLPAQGDARIYLVGDNAVSWYTTPSFVAGLCAMGASIFAYSQKSSNVGLSLVIGGAGIIALSQTIAHFIHLPSLEKKVAQKNSGPEALP